VSDALDLVQGIDHPSTYPAGRHNTARHTPPGRLHASSWARCLVLAYVCVPFNNSYRTPKPALSIHSVEMTGFEPVTFALQRRCSPAELHPQSYRVGLTGFEPVTPVLSGLCSNQLSYKPAADLNN
jgi:hypothetical protein